MSTEPLRIGGASGFWGDALAATPQLLDADVDYLVYDYLAEITMSIMARARAKSPDLGYATDFITGVLKPNLPIIAERGVKLIANAGGVNPRACAAAARELVSAAGLDLKVAVVMGDDLFDRREAFAGGDVKEMFSATAFPPVETVASINAYLGAFPIAAALDAGADIVITGRCVDSAVTLGACIHHFGWGPEEWDRLAGGSLAGHLLECGPQATGGNFTDWRLVADSIHEIGYPIAEVAADGTFVCTKPDGTGGLVDIGTVAEQMLYEIADPQAYVLPDVVCDFSQVMLSKDGEHRVRVERAKGYSAPDTYKVCATYADGFRGGVTMTFYGFEADEKAESFAAAVLQRARSMIRYRNMPDFTETSVEVLGAESQYGTARAVPGSREVVVKIAAKHPDQAGIGILLREMTGLGLATPPGLSGFAGARPKPSPVVRLFSFLAPKDDVAISVDVEGDSIPYIPHACVPFAEDRIVRLAEPPPPVFDGETAPVPLIKLAWGRSGDKGNAANVGIIARRAEYVPYLWAALTPDAVAKRFAHFLEGHVERFYLPGVHAINFVLHDVLGGGGVASIRNDPQGKGYAQLLLDHPIDIPRAMAEGL